MIFAIAIDRKFYHWPFSLKLAKMRTLNCDFFNRKKHGFYYWRFFLKRAKKGLFNFDFCNLKNTNFYYWTFSLKRAQMIIFNFDFCNSKRHEILLLTIFLESARILIFVIAKKYENLLLKVTKLTYPTCAPHLAGCAQWGRSGDK